MKKLAIVFIGFFLIAFSMNVNAQNEATIDADASANIIAPITLEQTVALNFGDIVPSATAGNVVLSSADGSRTNADGNLTLMEQITVAAAGQFKVTGTANATYQITLPGDGEVVLTGDGIDIPVNDFEFTGDEQISGNPPEDFFTVGATLEVGAGQTPGAYSGSYEVKVTYE